MTAFISRSDHPESPDTQDEDVENYGKLSEQETIYW